MLLYATEKGDVDGVFTDDGSDAARGHQFMRAVEEACGGVEETAKQIARTLFKVALMA